MQSAQLNQRRWKCRKCHAFAATIRDRSSHDVGVAEWTQTSNIPSSASVVGETRQKTSDSIEKSARESDDSWALAIEPKAAEKSRDTQHKNADGKGQCDFGNAPAKLLREWHPEYTPGVNGAQGHLQKDPSNSYTQRFIFITSLSKSTNRAAADSPRIAGGDQRPAENRRLLPDRGGCLYW